jgi:hypothetical protein
MSETIKQKMDTLDDNTHLLNQQDQPDPPTMQKRPVSIPFWSENPNILFQQKYLLEFFPVESMTYEQKLNAITRAILLLTLVGFIFSRSMQMLLISAITIGVIYLLYYYEKQEKEKAGKKKVTFEGFDASSPAYSYMSQNNIPIPDNVFDVPDVNNPLSNVLMTDYDYNPNKKPAPPLFNSDVNAQLLAQAKQLVVNQNPDQPDIADKLFQDLGENLVFEQSMRPFMSNPSTTIPNDQAAFAEFCYGSMVSCKEGNLFACARNMSHYTNY